MNNQSLCLISRGKLFVSRTERERNIKVAQGVRLAYCEFFPEEVAWEDNGSDERKGGICSFSSILFALGSFTDGMQLGNEESNVDLRPTFLFSFGLVSLHRSSFSNSQERLQ